eukprot:TRINITY_DN40758_c0_g1_i1.p1 TRINITY_DN40758_c0_g1~~TRINITY_DN40758_c0_g1_i1.p1  ORF type:complete len:178 (-),score=12.72 TRINITY_DN40758_c0_g1_i1:68-523(-)
MSCRIRGWRSLVAANRFRGGGEVTVKSALEEVKRLIVSFDTRMAIHVLDGIMSSDNAGKSLCSQEDWMVICQPALTSQREKQELPCLSREEDMSNIMPRGWRQAFRPGQEATKASTKQGPRHSPRRPSNDRKGARRPLPRACRTPPKHEVA